MRRITSDCAVEMNERTFIKPPHFSQRSGSTSNTSRINSAHRRRRSLAGGGFFQGHERKARLPAKEPVNVT